MICKCGKEVDPTDGLWNRCVDCAIQTELNIIAQLHMRKDKYKSKLRKNKMDEQIQWGYDEIERLNSGYFRDMYTKRMEDTHYEL